MSSFRLNQLIRFFHLGCPLSGSRFDRRTFADVEGTLSSVDHRPSTQVVGCLRHSPVQFKESLASAFEGKTDNHVEVKHKCPYRMTEMNQPLAFTALEWQNA